MYSKCILNVGEIVIKNGLKQNEYIIFLLCDFIEKFKSYRNKRLCTQNLFSKFRKIVIKNAT
jgi:hypothetical protein